jgi:Cu/Zn superoxide dismutase
VATLTGAAQVNPTGDLAASGTATLTLNEGQGQVCFNITLNNIDPTTVTGVHIHKAPVGQNGGPPVVPLSSNALSGCVNAPQAVIKDIVQEPQAYYVNVHTKDFQAGAVRGQLSK